MRSIFIANFVYLILVSGVFPEIHAQDSWPQFRGVDRDGKSSETDLLKQWPEGGPKLEWTAEGCGKGYSSVAIAEDRLYTMGDIGDEQFVIALSLDSGELVWKKKIGNANQGSYGGSRSTPTYDDGDLFCLTTDAALLCIDAKTGDIEWQRDLAKDFGAEMMLAMDKINWRFSESPLVDGDQVVVTPGGREAAMVAFNRSNGEEIWRTAIPEIGQLGRNGAGYSSAVISEASGVRQYVQLIGRGMISVDATTGKFLWGYNRIANDVANISSPVIIGEKVFASTGYQTGSALVEIAKSDTGDLSDSESLQAEEVYFLDARTFQNHHGGFIVHDGYIYGGHGHKLGLPICIRVSDGEVMWGPIRNRGMSSAAVCFADGQLYFRYQNGLMVLIEATPDEYREKGSFMIPDVKAESWSHPAIANGRLYLKEQERVLCYSVSATGQPEDQTPLETLAKDTSDQDTAKLHDIAQAWRQFIERKAVNDQFSGAVLLAHGEQVIWQEAFGQASKRFDVANNVETKFNLGSMNKMFTGVAICQLYEQGKLNFDDTVGEHLADYPNRDVAENVTIHQLLTHTSGLGSYWNEKYDQSYSSLRTLQDFLPLFVDDKLSFKPGSQSQYSNVGPVVLGLIIEQLSDQNYFDYVRDHIYTPSGMKNTDCYEMDVPVPNLAIGYTKLDQPDTATGNRWRNNYYLHAVRGGPAGGGFSTVGDMHRFATALQNDTLLKPETKALMLEGKIDLGPGFKYGYLFGEHVEQGLRRHGHTGGAPGISAEFFFYPELDLSFAVLSNYDNATLAVSRSVTQLIENHFADLDSDDSPAGNSRKFRVGMAFQTDGVEVRVAEVFEDSPAEKAGIQVNDQIQKIGESKLNQDLMQLLDKHLVSGELIQFTLNRNGQEIVITVKPELIKN